MLQVYEIRIKVFLLEDVKYENTQEVIARFIDSSFQRDEKLLELHNSNTYKYYSFNLFYPLEKKKCYLKGNIYTITLRTVDKYLANHFYEVLVNHYNQELKGLTADVRILPKKQIELLYSITPCLIKGNTYWKGELSPELYEERIKINLIKKYNQFIGCKLEENFPLFTGFEFMNRSPIATSYTSKGIRLLGDKICLRIADDAMSQEMAYLAMGTGVCENNARGFGFVNYRYY